MNPSGNRSPERETTNAEMRGVIEGIYARQQRMEAELACTRAALANAEAEGRAVASGANLPEEVPLSVLMKTMMETFSAANIANSGREPTGPRDWKPPVWDGRAETFRDLPP